MDDQSKSDPERPEGASQAGAGSAGAAGPAAAAEPDSPAEDFDATALVTPDPDATALAAPDPDATKLVRPDQEATQVASPASAPATAGSSVGNATTVLRPEAPNATSIMPPSSAVPPASERWSGKANVPTSRPPRDPDATSAWQPPEPGRVWWLPILMAIIGLVLVVGIAYAVVTALNNSDSANTPAPTSPVSPTSTPTQTPPSTATSTPPTSLSPTTPAPVGTFTVPSSLIGLPINDAEAILDGYGIPYTAVAQPDDTSLPNTVVNTAPAPGQIVPGGGTVTLYYAQPTTPSSPSTPTPSLSAGSGSPTS